VLDPLEQTLPPFVGKAVGDAKFRGWARALRYLARRPAEARHLGSLVSQVRVARASLDRFLDRLTTTHG